MGKYRVGDKVWIHDYVDKRSTMTKYMLEEFGGMVATIKRVISPLNFSSTYQIVEDPIGFQFGESDLSPAEDSCTDTLKKPITQRIEIPVPGGHLVAKTYECGGAYPCIDVYFVANGDTVEHGLCFAEVCAIENPNEIRVGTYFRDCNDVKDITVFPMWTKEEDNV